MAEGGVEWFVIDDFVVAIPSAAVTATMRERLAAGLYEGPERDLVRRLVRPGDRVLDLGAGAGLVAMVAARITGPAHVTAVEANPAMIGPIRRNFRRNGMEAIRLIRGAAMGRGHPGATVAFHVHPGFWSASVTRNPRLSAQTIEVAVKRFPALVRARDASVVLMDIEGAEQGILVEPIPASVRLMIVEMHPSLYGPAVLADLLASAKAQGFAVAERLKGDAVLALVRESDG